MPDAGTGGAVQAPTLELFGFRFTNVSRAEACQHIAALAKRRDRFYVIGFHDVALLMRSQDDEYLRNYYRGVDALFVDGSGLVAGARLLGKRFVQMVSAPFTHYELLAVAEQMGLKVFIVGATQEVLSAALARIRERLPRLQIVGSHNGYFNDTEAQRIAQNIAAADTDIVVLGMGTPYREHFVDRALRSLKHGVAMPIGGVLDVEAGMTNLAPNVIRKLGLEWFWRMIQEPRRLGPRYMKTHPRFVFMVLRSMSRRLIGHSAAAAS